MDSKTQRAKTRLQAAIEAVGGLHTVADLAQRWEISRQRAAQIAEEDGFPAPFLRFNKSDIYLGVEADEFRADRKPRKRPTQKAKQK